MSTALGNAFERRVKKHLEGFGLFAVRSAGSHGPADLVALVPGDHPPLLIQCKRGGRLPVVEWNELITIAKRFTAVPVLASPDDGDRQQVALFQLTGPRQLRSIGGLPKRRLTFVCGGDGDGHAQRPIVGCAYESGG